MSRTESNVQNFPFGRTPSRPTTPLVAAMLLPVIKTEFICMSQQWNLKEYLIYSIMLIVLEIGKSSEICQDKLWRIPPCMCWSRGTWLSINHILQWNKKSSKPGKFQALFFITKTLLVYWLATLLAIYLTNRFHFAVVCSVIDAQMTSECDKNKKVAHESLGRVCHWCSYHVVTSSVHL